MKPPVVSADENRLIARILINLAKQLDEYAASFHNEKNKAVVLEEHLPVSVPNTLWLDLAMSDINDSTSSTKLCERSTAIRIMLLPKPNETQIEAKTSQPDARYSWRKVSDQESVRLLNKRERTFIQLACSELTYVEIADRMCVSPRTVDGYREAVFDKLCVKTRVGLVMKAIRLGIHDPFTS